MDKVGKILSLFVLIVVSVLGAKAQDISNLTLTQVEELKKLQKNQEITVPNTSKLGSDDGVRSIESLYHTNPELINNTLVNQPTASKIFGRDMFNRSNLTFAPSLSIPTPENYIIASGDQLIIQIWGDSELEKSVKVSPEGNISIPAVGVVNVNGLSIVEAEKKIRSAYSNTLSGLDNGNTNIKITLGDIRSITVNIVGEAYTPGTYTLPSLATVFNALYLAGGVSDVGSLRNIKLYRKGKLVSTLDVYDYLINGSSDIDKRLEDNDVIVVSPYENIVVIEGKVKRPMSYELKRDNSLETLVDIAGGFTGDAYTQNISLSRRSGGKQYQQYTIDISEFPSFLINDRDSVFVGEILKTYANRVAIEGAVWKPGNYELSDKIKTVKDLVAIAEGLTDNAFAGRAQIIRTRLDKSLEVIPINISRILMGQNPDVTLQKDDKIFVSSINDLKESETVTIKGEVNIPDSIFRYGKGMTIQDLIIMSKGLKHSASLARIEVARRVKDANAIVVSDQRAELFSFTIPENLELTEEINSFELMPYDVVFVRRSPGYQEQLNLFIRGEVNFEGEYTISNANYRLSDLVNAAGGITPEAYAKGANLQRKVTVEDLQRIRSVNKLAKVANRENQGSETINLEEDILKIGDYYPIGIDLTAALADPQSIANITMREGDVLRIPTFDNTVSISGAVYYPTSMTYDARFSIRDYIRGAGDYSDMAKRRPFIIYMNGNIATYGSRNAKVEPGCKIVVPYKQYREPMNTQAWISISTSIVSMAAMVTSLFK